MTRLSVHTLRYYERIGLMDGVARAANGHRRYTRSDLAWLQTLMRLRDTGMPLNDILTYARLRSRGLEATPERRAIMEAHRCRVEARIGEMQRQLEHIGEKLAFYREIEANPDPAIGEAWVDYCCRQLENGDDITGRWEGFPTRQKDREKTGDGTA